MRSIYFFLFLDFRKNRVSLSKKLSFHNPGIFYDFAVKLFSGHSGICGTPKSVTQL